MTVTKQNRQVVILYASTFVGMIVGVLSSVINTRALSPDLYGDVRYVQNIISFVSSLLLFGYFTSGSRLLALSTDESHSRRIRGVMCAILGISIVIVMVVMTALYWTGAHSDNTAITSLYLISIPLCGNVLMLNYVNTVAQGDNHIGRIAFARLMPTTLYCIAAYFIYKATPASPRIMLALFNGIAIIVLAAVILSTRPDFHNLKESFRELNEENRKYGFNVYLGSLANVATGYIAGITLGQFCDNNANVGFYTLAITISGPLAMLPTIIGTTYFKKFASQERINPKVLKWSIILTTVSFVLYIACIRFIVAFLYDDSYSQVSTIASWLAIGMSLHGLGDMFNRFLGAHGEGQEIRNGAFLCGGVLIVGSILLVWLWQVKGAVATKILSDAVYFAAMLWYYLKSVPKR
ncbi:MAG: oligosaccharide flippase family protein [Bacteroidales bacterium]|nr:oligosaccharide flippase family protein [Bacteroidales bacterium]